jgi:hypothetical protein
MTATEEMHDALREGLHYTAPALNHMLAMHLIALEGAEDVLIERFGAFRGPREIAAEAIAILRHRALVRSYPARVEPSVAALRKAA